MCEDSEFSVSLPLSLWITLPAHHCLSVWEWGAVLAFWNTPLLWMGRSPAAWMRERFNLKSVQLTEEHSSCVSVCVCRGGCWPVPHQIRLWHHIYGRFLRSRFSRSANNVEALFLGCRNPSLLLTDTWCILTQTPTLPRGGPGAAPSGAVVEQVVSPVGCVLNPAGPVGRLSPSARNLPTKTGSGTLPPDTAAPQGPGGETFQRDAPWWICCYSHNVFT